MQTLIQKDHLYKIICKKFLFRKVIYFMKGKIWISGPRMGTNNSMNGVIAPVKNKKEKGKSNG